MSIRTKLAAAPFAHLLGLAARAEDDDERKQKSDESDDDYAKRMEKLDEDEAKKAEDDKKKDDEAKKAEDDKKKDDEAKKARKEAGEEDDEDDEKDDKEDDEKESRRGRAKSARRRERSRCAAIFASPSAAGIPHVAANLAFNTNMSRKEAIAVLQSVAVSQPQPIMAVTRSSLAERMSGQSVPQVGLDGGKAAPSGMSPVAAAIIAAGEKARPSK
ncbi:hypothetical protein B0E46_15810 [Rhodanobacter sp. B04]|uniref:hypothetical protein n=1 Tax=Rhodanobacter sp. B04 TaxID=1945860 RepID=UPI0009C703C1|nr:hypothetical protein [Rhodanobacter sp. B04]OOG61441.1 hypothetical protein B0E46_15810 [Rhodanobacter sp. B04]